MGVTQHLMVDPQVVCLDGSNIRPYKSSLASCLFLHIPCAQVLILAPAQSGPDKLGVCSQECAWCESSPCSPASEER